MTGLLEKYKDLIINLHEHDSFLENNNEEDLTEEERRKAEEEINQARSEGKCPMNDILSIFLLQL